MLFALLIYLINETCWIDQPRGILERLDAREVVIGDGGFLYALERRGYVTAGPYTPECTVEHPEAGEYMSIEECGRGIVS